MKIDVPINYSIVIGVVVSEKTWEAAKEIVERYSLDKGNDCEIALIISKVINGKLDTDAKMNKMEAEHPYHEEK